MTSKELFDAWYHPNFFADTKTLAWEAWKQSRKNLEAEQAQAVEPVTGEHAELIAAIKHELAEFAHNKVMETLLLDSVDMLEADAQQRSKPHGHCTHPKCRDIWSAYLEATEKLSKYEPGAVMHLNNSQQVAPYDQQALELCPACGWKAIMPGESCFVCNMKIDVHQVAAPTLKIKPFTQRLRDNREADYSLDALMPPTRKEIESAMHEEIVELRGALKAQQVAVPMTESEIISIAYDVNCMPEDCTDASLIRFARAITQAKDIQIDILENKIDRLEWENKGISEWRAEYLNVKRKLDAIIQAQ